MGWGLLQVHFWVGEGCNKQMKKGRGGHWIQISWNTAMLCDFEAVSDF